MSSTSSTSPGGSSLVARGISKRYDGQWALDGVDFTLRRGEIHALLGENGAGKSTLVNVLAGVVRPDEGSVMIGGQPLRPGSPADSAAAGIGMVHQHFSLIPALTVAENLSLAVGTGPAVYGRPAVLAAQGLSLAERFGWEFNPDTPVRQLSIGRQQRLEILKVLQRDARWLLFDEPTAVLSPPEVDELFQFLQRLREEGRAIVFISHKLDEVRLLADRITVLRRGRLVGECPRDTPAAKLARLMIGSAPHASPTVELTEPTQVLRPDEPGRPPRQASGEGGVGAGADVARALMVRHLRVRDDRGVEMVRDLSFEVDRGEIFGVAGVDGNGQAELAESVVGLRKPAAGSVILASDPATHADAGWSHHRPGYIPQDRRRAGLVLAMSVRENLALEIHSARQLRWGPFLRRERLWSATRDMARRFDIRSADDRLPASALSGGNQQKIVVARALTGARSLLVAVNPTRGLDLHATQFVHQQLLAASAAGVGVLLISTELDEVLTLSDRVGVLYNGRFQGIVPPSTPRAAIGHMMGGSIDQRVPG